MVFESLEKVLKGDSMDCLGKDKSTDFRGPGIADGKKVKSNLIINL